MENFAEYNENAVIVKRCVWKDIEKKLKDLTLECRDKYIKINIEYSLLENSRYSYHLGSFTINGMNMDAPGRMENLKKEINDLAEIYKNNFNIRISNQDLEKELQDIKSTRWYKLFGKKNK